jgi:NADPH:quinone reductase-like Zn-dependent oxidoreductase
VKVMRLNDSAQRPALVEEEVAQPQPGRGEVLVRVYAAGVTPTEILWYPTSHSKTGEQRNRAIPGHEFSGVVAALAPDVAGLDLDQEVYGMNDWFSDGAMAEYCITQPLSVAPKPPRLTHVEAASVPIGALTAWQGLFDRAQLQAGERVLVQGGAGAVGVFVIQLARLHGAYVIATASSNNLDFVSQLGSQQVIDYFRTNFEESVQEVDVVFDTVGGDTLRRSWSLLKPSGRMVTIAADSEEARGERVKQAFFIVEPNRKQLVEIGNLLEAGHLKPVVDAVLPLAQASTAYSREVSNRRGRGKLVVAVVRENAMAKGRLIPSQ